MTPYTPRGRSIPRFKVPQQDGAAVTRSAGTRDPHLLEDMRGMLRTLRRQRRWDALGAVGAKQLTLIDLFDAWRGGEAALEAALAGLDDVDLEPYVARWAVWLRQRKGPDTQHRYVTHVRSLIPAERPFRRAALTPEVIETWLAGLTLPSRQGARTTARARTAQPASPGTVRRYHAALRSFVDYLQRIRVLDEDPMLRSKPPAANDPRCVFLELPEVRRLLELSDATYRPLFALMYGTGIEVTTALGLRRRDVDLARREIHARGTKHRRGRINYRDRMVRVAEWAWPEVEAHVRALLPDARLFPAIRDRHAVTKYHKALMRSDHLGRPELRLHDSRHHWAVRQVRAGTPIELVARQLGHADAVMALRVYGRFRPTHEDRDRWERLAAEQDPPAVRPAASN